MFRVRKIADDVMPGNRAALRHVQEILRTRFDDLGSEEIDTLAEKLANPFTHHFIETLHVAENKSGRIMGFSLLMYDPDIRFAYLDYLAADRVFSSRGVGGALYEHVRDEARTLKAKGLFFECLPDDPSEYESEKEIRAARARLRFYEQYGARPIIGTDYERPIHPGDTCMPLLVYDPLGATRPLRAKQLARFVRAILERKFGYICPAEYVETVVHSIKEDPVKLRPFKYLKKLPVASTRATAVRHRPFFVVFNDKHDIHHVKDRGYVESPVRISRIRKELSKSPFFEEIPPRRHSMRLIESIHDKGYLDYLRKACARVEEKKSIYPYVFPVRNRARPPRDITARAGYYCIDTFTPLNRNAWLAARRAVDCTLTAADQLLQGWPLAYSLVRPPGHHAESGLFGGFCYLNNGAIASHLLSAFGRVAILDLDYHHGNGQQDIFYQRSDVLTVSLHGHPDFAYPYFSGFSEETGEGAGKGYNINFPLPEDVDGDRYELNLKKALKRIRAFTPDFLVVLLGLDTARLDPTGTWSLRTRDFHRNATLIAELGLPTLVVQEGGYRTRTLGANAAAFLIGLHERSPR